MCSLIKFKKSATILHREKNERNKKQVKTSYELARPAHCTHCFQVKAYRVLKTWIVLVQSFPNWFSCQKSYYPFAHWRHKVMKNSILFLFETLFSWRLSFPVNERIGEALKNSHPFCATNYNYSPIFFNKFWKLQNFFSYNNFL